MDSQPSPDKKQHPFGLSCDEVLSLKITAIMTCVTLLLLSFFLWQKFELGVVLTGGAIGGFFHEFIQSQGKVLFITRKDDGLYLGSISGLMLGMVAGMLVFGGATTGIIPSPSVTNTMFASFGFVQSSSGSPQLVFLLFQAFIAGLALKGVSEAATSPAKTVDSFDIISVDFIGTTNNFSNELGIHIKNNVSGTLQLQLLKITDSQGRTSVQNYSKTIVGKDVDSTNVQYKWENKQDYTITVISLNGQAVTKVTSPVST